MLEFGGHPDVAVAYLVKPKTDVRAQFVNWINRAYPVLVSVDMVNSVWVPPAMSESDDALQVVAT